MSEAATLFPILAWTSPAYPVGSYAYSHGLEWAVDIGDVADEASLGAWLSDLLAEGSGRNDAILLAHAWRAAVAGDAARLAEVSELAMGLAPSRELRLETGQQGRSFMDATQAAWPCAALSSMARELEKVAYPVAVGTAAGAHRLPLEAMLQAYLSAFAQNLVSAAMRLAPIGQTAGARVLADLAPLLMRLAAEAPTLTLDDLGSATFRAELGSLLHETQYSRLFRS